MFKALNADILRDAAVILLYTILPIFAIVDVVVVYSHFGPRVAIALGIAYALVAGVSVAGAILLHKRH